MGVEFVFAGVAVAPDEIVAAGVGGQTDEPVRLRPEGRERGSLEQSAGHLLGPQSRHRKDGPGILLRFRRAVAHGAIKAEYLCGGDGAYQAVEVISVRGEIVGEAAQTPGVALPRLEGRRQARPAGVQIAGPRRG